MLRSIFEQLFDLGDQRILRCGADLLVHQFPALEEDNGGDVAHAVFRRDLIVLLHVALGDQNAALILGGELVHNGGYHAAGTAPFGPEVDDDGQL